MICPEGYYKEYLKGKTSEQINFASWFESDAEGLYMQKTRQWARLPDGRPIPVWRIAGRLFEMCLKEDSKAIGSIGLMIGNASNLDLPGKKH